MDNKIDLLTYIQGKNKHGIDLLMALHELTIEKQTESNTSIIEYKEIEMWMNEHGYGLAAYPPRKEELKALGLITTHPRKNAGEDVELTEKGIKVAEIVCDLIRKLHKVDPKSPMLGLITA